jgi:outer membrane scaffolding protein for murein synthesis (MipA/OmpV family)
MRLKRLIYGFVLMAPMHADAGSLMDFIRDYDLNDYSLGLAVAAGQNPFLGSDTSTIAYPILTSFRHSSMTDDWLLIQGENLGFRYITDNDWELGLIGRIQTLGVGVANNDDLLGLEERKWAVEAGPLIGWRRFPVHVQFRSYWEAPNRHSGSTSELEFRLPREHQRGFFVPSLTFKYLTSGYSNYYFGVSPAEATLIRPEYIPGSAISTSVDLRHGLELGSHWLLQTRVGVEFLDSAIQQSPIVDRDHLWSASISLAYNADVFRPRDFTGDQDEPDLEFRLGAFSTQVDSTLLLDATSAQPGDEIELEDFLGISDGETVAHFEASYRVAFFHRFDLRYFELQRAASTTLQRDIWFGDTFYPEGTNVSTRAESQLLRLGYSYSLMRDGQKELGVTAGLTQLVYDSKVQDDDVQSDADQVQVETILPTFGVFASVPFGDKWRLGANIDLFVLGFDGYEGHMTYLALNIERSFNDNFGAGLSYNFYGIRLQSKNDDLNGTLRVRYQGPVLYLSAKF